MQRERQWQRQKGKDDGKTFSLVAPSDVAFEGSVSEPERPGFAFEKDKTSSIARPDNSRHPDKRQDMTKTKRDKDMLSNGGGYTNKTKTKTKENKDMLRQYKIRPKTRPRSIQKTKTGTSLRGRDESPSFILDGRYPRRGRPCPTSKLGLELGLGEGLGLGWGLGLGKTNTNTRNQDRDQDQDQEQEQEQE
jgi:hypothetical protein